MGVEDSAAELLTPAASRDVVSPLALPPSPNAMRRTRAALLLILLAFVAVVQFEHLQLPAYPPFILIFGVAMVLNNAYTAALLLSQYNALRRRSLLVLAGGYLFSAFIAIPYMVSFPGLLAPGLQLGRGTDAEVWLVLFWQGTFPLLLIAYALLRDRAADIGSGVTSAWPPIVTTFAIAVGSSFAVTLLIIYWSDQLPDLVGNNQFTAFTLTTRYGIAFLGVFALATLWHRQRRSLLDSWLTIVAAAWAASLGILMLSEGRFELAWYGGRVFVLVASSVLLIVLLVQTGALYASLTRTMADERAARERHLKVAQERFAGLSRLSDLRQTVTGVAFELRQRLSEVTKFLRTGKTPNQPDGTADAARKRAEEQAEGAMRLAERLADYVAKAKATLDNESLETVIENAALLALAGAKGAPVNVGMHLEAHCSWALIDSPGVQHVLLSLIKNAVEATRDMGVREIGIRAAPAEGGMIEICVSDSGPGVAPDVREKLFEAFVTTKPDAVGVGLWVSRSIVEQNGGRLWLAKSDGRGTTFCFTVRRGEPGESTAQGDGRGMPDAAKVASFSSAAG